MRVVLVILGLLLVVLQSRLWFGDGGLIEIHRLQQAVDAQQIQNKALKERNAALKAEVKDLKTGVTAIEERARNDLGMIKRGETFYQTVGE
jgi:cell division protein FtsB